MRFLYRLRWDDVYTDWEPLATDYIKRLSEEGTSLLLRVTNPEKLVERSGGGLSAWQIEHSRGGGLPVFESTLITVEIKGVK